MYGQPLLDELTAHCVQAIPSGVTSVIEIASGSALLAREVKKRFPRFTTPA